MVRSLSCGRSDPGSNPGPGNAKRIVSYRDILFYFKNIFKIKCCSICFSIFSYTEEGVNAKNFLMEAGTSTLRRFRKTKIENYDV